MTDQKKCSHDDEIIWDYDDVDFSYEMATVNGKCKECGVSMYMYYQIDPRHREHIHSTLEKKSTNFDCDALTVTFHCKTCYRNIQIWYYYDFSESEIERNQENNEVENEEIETETL